MPAAVARPMWVWGLDLALTTGWAILKDDLHVASGHYDLRVSDWEGRGAIMLRLESLLDDMMECRGVPAAVAIEEPLPARPDMGTASTGLLHALASGVAGWCERRGVPMVTVPVTKVKRHATENAKSKKAAMVQAANETWNLSITDHNQADAIWVASAATAGLRAPLGKIR